MLAALTEYETLLLVVALVFISFALVAALVVPRRRPDFPAKRLGIFIGVCVALFVAQMGAVFLLAEVGEADEPVHEATPTETVTTETSPTETTPTETAPPETTTETTPTETTPTETTEASGDPIAGKEVFLTIAAPSCGGCHTLADAGTTGTVGPNLDAASPSFDKVVERVTEGRAGMPSFSGSLSEEQIDDVAAYVSSVAGS